MCGVCVCTRTGTDVHPGRGVYFKELHDCGGLASPESSGEHPGGPGKSQGPSSKTVWRQNFLFLGEVRVFGFFFFFPFLLRPSADWTRPTHIKKNNLFYSEASDVNGYLILKIPSQGHPDWGLTEHLGTVAWRSRHMKSQPVLYRCSSWVCL